MIVLSPGCHSRCSSRHAKLSPVVADPMDTAPTQQQYRSFLDGTHVLQAAHSPRPVSASWTNAHAQCCNRAPRRRGHYLQGWAREPGYAILANLLSPHRYFLRFASRNYSLRVSPLLTPLPQFLFFLLHLQSSSPQILYSFPRLSLPVSGF